jgi:hypothetical protein
LLPVILTHLQFDETADVPAFNPGGVIVGSQQPCCLFRLGFLVVEAFNPLAAIRAFWQDQVLQTIRTNLIVSATRKIKKFYWRTTFVADGAGLHRFITSNKIYQQTKYLFP